MNRLRFVPVIVPAAALLLAAPCPAQRDLATAIPAGSYLYAELPGLDRCLEAASEVGILRLVRNTLGADGEAQVEQLALARLGRQLGRFHERLERYGLDGKALRALFAGPMAFGVGRPTMFGDDMVPSCALITEVTGDAGAFRAAIANLERVLLAAGRDQVTLEKREVGGVPTTVLFPRDHNGAITHATVNDLFLLSNSEDYLRECLGALRHQEASLAGNPALRRGRDKLQGTRLASVFVNLKPMLGWARSFMPYEADHIAEALGTTDCPDLFYGVAQSGRGSSELYYVDLPGSEHGALKSLFARPVTNAAASWCKPSVALYLSASIDCEGFAQACERLVAALPRKAQHELREELHEEVFGELDRELRRHGSSLDELHAALGTLGNEVAIAAEPAEGMPMPLITAFVSLREPQRAAEALGQLLRRLDVPDLEVEEYEGATVYSTSVQAGPVRLSPSVAVKDDMLLLSNHKGTLKSYVRRGEIRQGSLADDEDFQRASRVARGACGFANLRSAPLIKAYWGAASMAMQGAMGRSPVQVRELPSGEQMTDAIDDVVMTVSGDADGLTLRVHHPLGLGALLPLAGSAIDWGLRTRPGGEPATPSTQAAKPKRRIY